MEMKKLFVQTKYASVKMEDIRKLHSDYDGGGGGPGHGPGPGSVLVVVLVLAGPGPGPGLVLSWS